MKPIINFICITFLLIFMTALSTICLGQHFSKVWTTDSLFLKPESALFESKKNIIYISNINGEYLAKDGNGFISKIKTNGKIEKLKWIEGLNNPQGMGLYKTRLYVADINRIVQINTRTAKIENTFEVDSPSFSMILLLIKMEISTSPIVLPIRFTKYMRIK